MSSATLLPDRTEEQTIKDQELLDLLESIANVPHCESTHKRTRKNPPIELPDCSHTVTAIFQMACTTRPFQVCQNIADYVRACYELPIEKAMCTRCWSPIKDCWVISPLPSVP